MTHLETLGITGDYFIYPAINWGAKSENLKQVASRIISDLMPSLLLTIRRRNGKKFLPVCLFCRTFTDKQIMALPDLPEFRVPLTETSLNRRQSFISDRNETGGNKGEFRR